MRKVADTSRSQVTGQPAPQPTEDPARPTPGSSQWDHSHLTCFKLLRSGLWICWSQEADPAQGLGVGSGCVHTHPGTPPGPLASLPVHMLITSPASSTQTPGLQTSRPPRLATDRPPLLRAHNNPRPHAPNLSPRLVYPNPSHHREQPPTSLMLTPHLEVTLPIHIPLGRG
jgi:hypothetical protein